GGGGGSHVYRSGGGTNGKHSTAAAASAAVAKALLGLAGSGQIVDPDSAIESVRPIPPPLLPQSPTQIPCREPRDGSKLALQRRAVATVRKAAVVQAAPPHCPSMAAATKVVTSPPPSALPQVAKLTTARSTRPNACETEPKAKRSMKAKRSTGTPAAAVAAAVAMAAATRVITQLPSSQTRSSPSNPTQIHLSESSSSSISTGAQRNVTMPSRPALATAMLAEAAATAAGVNTTAVNSVKAGVGISAADEDGVTARTVATIQRTAAREAAGGGAVSSSKAAAAVTATAGRLVAAMTAPDDRMITRTPRISLGSPHSSGQRMADASLPLPLSVAVPVIDTTVDDVAIVADVSSLASTFLKRPKRSDVSQASPAEAITRGDATVQNSTALLQVIDLQAAVAAAVAAAAGAVEDGLAAAAITDSVVDTVATGSITALSSSSGSQRRRSTRISNSNSSSKDSFDYDSTHGMNVYGEGMFGRSGNRRGHEYEGEYEGEDDESCFVCLERRSQLAFGHASGVLHVGICRACLPALQERGWARTCPLCRQDVTAMRELH
ncbi:hypothetical protein Vretimale_6822, partial [Volvox reticuliferus]